MKRRKDDALEELLDVIQPLDGASDPSEQKVASLVPAVVPLMTSPSSPADAGKPEDTKEAQGERVTGFAKRLI